MSNSMIEYIEKRMNEEDFSIYVSDLLDSERLDGEVVIGIAKQIIDRGVSSLTPNQKITFIRYGLLLDNYVDECNRCTLEIPWSEMLFALDDGFCAYCRHMIEKDD